MQPFEQAAFSPAGAGQIVTDRFGRHTIRIAAAETGGRLGVFEAEVPPGEGPPPHIHDHEDEFFRVLSGSFAFWCNGARVDLTADGTLVVPRGAVHRFQNTGSTPGRLMCVMTPGGFEGFFPAVAANPPESPAAMEAIASRFHLRFVMDAAEAA